jgi:hypothetical protein
VQSVDFPCLSHVHPPRTVSLTAWKTVPAVTEKLNQLCRMYLSAPDILAQMRSAGTFADCVYATAAELTAYCEARMDATGVSAYIRREERIFRDDVAKAPRPEGAVPTGEHKARLAQQSAARQAKHASITALLVVLTLQHTADTHTSPDAQRRSAMEDEANAPSSSTPEPATQACSDADSCGDTISENGTADDDSTTSTGTSSVTSTSGTPLDPTESSVSGDGDTGPTTSDSSTRSPTPLMAILLYCPGFRGSKPCPTFVGREDGVLPRSDDAPDLSGGPSRVLLPVRGIEEAAAGRPGRPDAVPDPQGGAGHPHAVVAHHRVDSPCGVTGESLHVPTEQQ